jgi:hypothetical protein
MIRIFVTVILCSAFFVQGYSQKLFIEKTFSENKYGNPSQKSVAETDTLGINNFFEGTPTQYYVPDGSYVAGTNSYNDKAKVQQFNLTTSLVVEEVILWFGTTIFTSGNPNSAVVVKLYRLDSLGTNSYGQTAAPGSVIDSVIVPLSDISTSGYTAVSFSSHPIVYERFTAGIDLTTIAAGDSVGLMTSTDGNAGETELSWEKWNNNTWHTMFQAWPLDIDFAIWTVVDTSSAGINDAGFFNGLKMSQNQPNPAGSETTIQYELQNNANVTFEMYDVLGKKVFSMNEGAQNQGKHSINLTTEKVASGTYYYSLKADNNRITKKLVVAK